MSWTRPKAGRSRSTSEEEEGFVSFLARLPPTCLLLFLDSNVTRFSFFLVVITISTVSSGVRIGGGAHGEETGPAHLKMPDEGQSRAGRLLVQRRETLARARETRPHQDKEVTNQLIHEPIVRLLK